MKDDVFIKLHSKETKNKIDHVYATLNICPRIFSPKDSLNYEDMLDSFFEIVGG